MALLLGASLAGGPVLAAQTTTGPAETAPAPSPQEATQSAIAGLEPAMKTIGDVIPELNISKWKASRGLRDGAVSDVESIQQDLGRTLPELIEKANASGNQLAPTFAVYRNVDALYDVLLRVASLANVAGSQEEARSLEKALRTLEASRAGLGKALLSAATAQDTELARLREAVVKAAKKEAAPVKTIIVNDGPVKKHGGRVKAR